MGSASACVSRLIDATAALDDPTLYAFVGDKAHGLETVLSRVTPCGGRVSLDVVAHRTRAEEIAALMEQWNWVRVASFHTADAAHLSTFRVSRAGYYLQSGLAFDEGSFSLDDPIMVDFLLELFHAHKPHGALAA